MSAYITLATPMIDTECLLAALVDRGFRTADIESHAQPVALRGFEGSLREQAAHIVIRKAHVGSGSNDLGFLRTETGYRALISDYDRQRFSDAWMQQLHQAYQDRLREKEARIAEAERQRIEAERRRLIEAQRQSIQERARKLGYRVQESREGAKLRMVLVKRTY